MKEVKNINELKEKKKEFIKQISEELGIVYDDASKIVLFLEDKSILKITAPETPKTNIEFITNKSNPSSNKLSMLTRKPGNIILNIKEDYVHVISLLLSGSNVIYSLSTQNCYGLITGIVAAFVSVAGLSKIKLDENSVSILLALQKHKVHKVCSAEIDKCRDEANSILALYKKPLMNENDFQKAVSYLLEINTIDKVNDKLLLKESLIGKY